MNDTVSPRWRQVKFMTSRIRDLTLKYDWYICHGNINAKRTIQFEYTT